MESRNKWAHQKPFSTDDAYRALDSMHRLLNAVGAGKEADELEAQKAELMRVKFDEQARHERRKTQATLGLEAGTAAGLKPWRDRLRCSTRDPSPCWTAGPGPSSPFRSGG